jgi:probable F420-dependent oxidoreductase
MKIGVVFPQTEIGNDPAAIRDYAQAAEGLGFKHILAYDHVLGANPDRPEGWSGPYTFNTPFHEVFVLFSYLAGITSTLELVTGILILPQRQTALVAKQTASLDVLSGGRLRVGVGIGWNKVEYLGLNENFHNRGKRIEEQVEVLRRLWSEPLVTFDGQWHHIPDAGINPLPVQKRIPIWFGGHAEPVLQRLVDLGDGWMPNYPRAADARQALDKISEITTRSGRNRSEIGLEPRLSYGDGNPSTWHEIMAEWRAAGATHLTFNTMGCGFRSPAEHIQAIRKFSDTL